MPCKVKIVKPSKAAVVWSRYSSWFCIAGRRGDCIPYGYGFIFIFYFNNNLKFVSITSLESIRLYRFFLEFFIDEIRNFFLKEKCKHTHTRFSFNNCASEIFFY